MQPNTPNALKLLTIIMSSFLLSACGATGAYFSKSDTTKPITTEKHRCAPIIHDISAQLYENTSIASSPHYNWWFHKKINDYIIGPTDVLLITVWDHPELSTPIAIGDSDTNNNNSNLITAPNSNSTGLLVNAKGNLFFPYAGNVHVAGLTTEQVSTLLAKRLSKHIQSPQVNVRIIKFRHESIQVIGAVNHPGAVTINDKPATILNAIAACGGINPMAAKMSEVFVVRGSPYRPTIFTLNAQSPSNLLISEKFRLLPNDILYIPNSLRSKANDSLKQLVPALSIAAYSKALLE